MKHICAHASPGLGAEEGANACPGEAAGKCENAGARAALKRGSTAGSDADGLASENKCIAAPSVGAEGDARAGGNTAARMRMVPGLAMHSLSMKIRLQQYFMTAPLRPANRTVLCCFSEKN